MRSLGTKEAQCCLFWFTGPAGRRAAAGHAIRPVFPGREAVVAAAFGLVHGMAFSETLADLDLTGAQLVLSLLGFNLGIELMQLSVVALVLPPLCLLARTPAYPRLRVGAAAVTAVAAAAWLAARLGLASPIAAAADRLAPVSPWIVAALWAAAVLVTAGRRTAARAKDTLSTPSVAAPSLPSPSLRAPGPDDAQAQAQAQAQAPAPAPAPPPVPAAATSTP